MKWPKIANVMPNGNKSIEFNLENKIKATV